ncbi:MAG: FAD-dependent oxidoreductase [Candidatus Cloacimonetes bacterium]|nr:FAD-dependent oxidoreductase [Candidatus Cloacimonadota bacterium]
MFLTDAQLRSEMRRCEYCEEKPCKKACPCDCSPADFIMAARGERASDFKRAAGIILSSNPLGGICGEVCPDYHCMQACSREGFDTPINIPAVQSTIIRKAKELGSMPHFFAAIRNNRKAAILGAGPAGIGTAISLIQMGYEVYIFESDFRAGGQATLIPQERMEPQTLISDLEFLGKTFGLNISYNASPDPEELADVFDAVVISTGLNEPIRLKIPNDELAVYGTDPLRHPDRYDFKDKKIAVVGGAIAADIALLAKGRNALHVEMIVLESYDEMPLCPEEKRSLQEAGIHITNRMRISEIVSAEGRIAGIKIKPVSLEAGESFHPSKIHDEEGSGDLFRTFDQVYLAVGNRSTYKNTGDRDNIWLCGDMANGPGTVVEAVAAGKNVALMVDAKLSGKAEPDIDKPCKNCTPILGWNKYPVPLITDFFGRELETPFILSAAPPTDGYDQVSKAYQAGWSGVVMKTAFDGLDIHIPGEYMFVFNIDTYANCDNVSEHPLARVCQEIRRLADEYPDKLTMASTGGPVTGDDAADKAVWQANTKMLEDAGAMGIEYSLSCPQGGDGTHGDIVAQNAELSAKIIDWVMQISNPEIPKLFKLTGAVTSIYPIITAIREILARYPGKKAGITLANTFPTLAFREDDPTSSSWPKGIIVGMSGAAVLPISYLSLARAGKLGVAISGNGGAMDYLAAANLLALGASTVQFCTIAEKYGLGIIEELKMGLSHYLEARSLGSISELIGIAQPNPITDFMDLPKQSKVSALKEELCVHCGNCSRCPYLAITMNEKRLPQIDEDKCIGCSLCVQKCFAGALYMKEKTGILTL